MVSLCSDPRALLFHRKGPVVKLCNSPWGMNMLTFPALCCLSSLASSSPVTLPSTSSQPSTPIAVPRTFPLLHAPSLPNLSFSTPLPGLHVLSFARSLPHAPPTQELIPSHQDLPSMEPPIFPLPLPTHGGSILLVQLHLQAHYIRFPQTHSSISPPLPWSFGKAQPLD